MASTSDRLRRLPRLRHPRVWRTLFHALTEPDNDEVWEFVLRRGRRSYLDEPKPWFTPGAVDCLAKTIRLGLNVFEWGAGSSTLWFAKAGCNVVSYETDRSWTRLVGERLNLGSVVEYVEDRQSYFPELQSFQIVVIDGKWRPECARHVLDSGFSGLVVFDDSHRQEYAAEFGRLSERAQRSRHFAGLSPQLSAKMTSLFWLE